MLIWTLICIHRLCKLPAKALCLTACWCDYERTEISYTGSGPSLPADVNIKVQTYRTLPLGLYCLLMWIWKYWHIVQRLLAFTACWCEYESSDIVHLLWAYTACWRDYESTDISYTGSGHSLQADVNMEVQTYHTLALWLQCLLL